MKRNHQKYYLQNQTIKELIKKVKNLLGSGANYKSKFNKKYINENNK